MSKSRGNVVDPDEQIARYGADTFRAYLMFMRPWNEGGPWDTQGIEGVHRWLQRVWHLATGSPPAGEHRDGPEARAIRRRTHATIKRVTEDLDAFRFNTAIAALMEFTNALQGYGGASRGEEWDEAIRSLLLMVAPIAPHLAEELWARRGEAYSIHQHPWPAFDPDAARAERVTLIIQVNGKVRDRIDVPAGLADAEARELALGSERVRTFIADRPVAGVFVVPGRLVNIVLSEG